jgi:hypothetical protein
MCVPIAVRRLKLDELGISLDEARQEFLYYFPSFNFHRREISAICI